MSFSRGFNTGFSIFTDMAKLSMAREQAELSEQAQFGFYTSPEGERVEKENAFGEDGNLLEGFKFTPGTAQLTEERVESLRFQNDPEMQNLAKETRRLANENSAASLETRRLMNRRTLNEELGAELYNFYSGFDELVSNPQAWEAMPEKKKDFFINTQSNIAQGIKDFYGVDPLALFDDKVVSGYESAARLQNEIMKNPEALENLNLGDYASGLNSLFNLQTNKYEGKTFDDGERKGKITNVSIDFENFEIDPDTNQVILNALYDVDFDGEEVKGIEGILNDTDRDVIRPSLEADDSVAFSLNDLLDYMSAGASVLGSMTNSENKLAFEVASKANLRRASMYDAVDLKTASAFESEVDKAFAKQMTNINSALKQNQIDISYQEFFTEGSKPNPSGLERKEDKVISAIINTLSPAQRNKLLIQDDSRDSGFRLIRGDDNKPLPFYDLKFELMEDREVIRERLLGNTGLQDNAFLNPENLSPSFKFKNLPQDITYNTNIAMIETMVDSKTIEFVKTYLAQSDTEFTTANVLPILIALEKQDGVQPSSGD